MPDTVRTDAEILALLSDIADDNAEERALRDMYVTLRERDAAAGGPEPFVFSDVTDAPLQTAYAADIDIVGPQVAFLARSTGLTFSVNGGAQKTEAVVTGGDVLKARMSSSAAANTETVGTLTVGPITASWSITTGNFWTPMSAWPEMVGFAFMQEDLPEGPVATWQGKGVRPKTANGSATKLPNNGGVLFTGTQSLSWGVDTESVIGHRWWVAIARTDAPGSGTAIPILTVHTASGGNPYRQPALRFEQAQLISWIRDAGGDKHLGAPANTTDFNKWHVLVGWLDDWEHRAWIDGVELGPRPFGSWSVPSNSSWLGAGAGGPGSPALPKALAIDCVIVGQGMPWGALMEKIVGWACWRANRVDLLPATHPYKAAPPQPDGSEGEPDLYKHDQAAWSTWIATPQSARFVNRGNPLPAASDYEVVFLSNFRGSPVADVADDIAGTPNDLWYAPGYNSAAGGSATLLAPGAAPDCYLPGPDGLTLRLQESVSGNNQWRSGAILSVNRAGKGHYWGKGRFRIRCRFPQMAAPRPGFFPAFWAYDADYLPWRTRNRLEWDIFEYDGLNGLFINTSFHVHPQRFAYPHPDISVPDQSHKMFGTQLTAANGFDPQIDIYDGQFHIWEGRIEDDFTYVLVDDQEVGRMPTMPWLLRPKHLIVTWAYRSAERAATPGQVYDMTIDWIEVQQKAPLVA